MSAIRLVGSFDRNFAWNGTRLYDDADFRAGPKPPCDLRGPAASVQCATTGKWRLVRDPLGINKLFWAQGKGERIVFAARPRRLIDEGWSLEQIRAIPRGCVVDLCSAEPSLVQHSIVPAAWFSPVQAGDRSTEDIGNEIRDLLERYMAAIAAAYPRAQVFVCLSGGLDSSGIAALAAEHFAKLTAVSFDLARTGGRASEDRVTAQRLARDLELPLLEVTVSPDALLEKLDTVLVHGIDWRDFNVHAGLVNSALAEAIDHAVAGRAKEVTTIVLTGDLANEFLVDYHAEQYKGVTYYQLPRLSSRALRASLVRGLDTSHREVGVFGAWNLAVVQPYAAAVDAYLTLPEAYLALENRKQQLCRTVFGARLPDYIYSRPKTRAQFGGANSEGGVLAACVDRGFDGAWLRQRFADLHDVDDLRILDRFMRAGCYRSGVPSLTDASR